jgi:hypothetical protein
MWTRCRRSASGCWRDRATTHSFGRRTSAVTCTSVGGTTTLSPQRHWSGSPPSCTSFSHGRVAGAPGSLQLAHSAARSALQALCCSASAAARGTVTPSSRATRSMATVGSGASLRPVSSCASAAATAVDPAATAVDPSAPRFPRCTEAVAHASAATSVPGAGSTAPDRSAVRSSGRFEPPGELSASCREGRAASVALR